MKCPRCNRPMQEFVGLYECDCGVCLTLDQWNDLQDSLRLGAIALSEDVVVISAEPGDAELVRRIFYRQHISFNPLTKKYVVHQAQKYDHVPCVQAAFKALKLQMNLFELQK